MILPVLAILAFVGAGYWLLTNGGALTLAGDGLGGSGTKPPFPADDKDNVAMPNWNMGAHTPITNDPATWPSGDRIWNICHAIALAEGANIAGSAPDRNNNPGDLSDGANQFGYDPAVTDSHVTRFPDKDTGWKWLYQKISNAVRGYSSVYNADMTWTEFGKKYAGNWQVWTANVTRYLGVSPDSTVRQYVG